MELRLGLTQNVTGLVCGHVAIMIVKVLLCLKTQCAQSTSGYATKEKFYFFQF